MVQFVQFEIPSEVKEKQLHLLEKLKKAGKFRAGVNEVTKAVERGTAKLVFLAEDTSPQEVVMHIPVLCKEKNIPFSYVATRKELGEKIGLSVSAATVALTDEGDAKKEIAEFVKSLLELQKGSEAK